MPDAVHAIAPGTNFISPEYTALRPDDEAVADAAEVEEGYCRVMAQMSAQFMDKAVERVAVVIIVVVPDVFHQLRGGDSFTDMGGQISEKA